MSAPCLLTERARLSRCGYSSTAFLKGTELLGSTFAWPCRCYSPGHDNRQRLGQGAARRSPPPSGSGFSHPFFECTGFASFAKLSLSLGRTVRQGAVEPLG